MTDSSSNEVNAYDYDPYGGILNTASNPVANPFQYEGGYFESSTGLVKFGTRYYNPNLGRWTQQDPVGGSLASPDTLNRYLYVTDNPVNGVDLSGKLTVSLIKEGDFVIGVSLNLTSLDLVILSTPLAVWLIGAAIQLIGAATPIGELADYIDTYLIQALSEAKTFSDENCGGQGASIGFIFTNVLQGIPPTIRC